LMFTIVSNLGPAMDHPRFLRAMTGRRRVPSFCSRSFWFCDGQWRDVRLLLPKEVRGFSDRVALEEFLQRSSPFVEDGESLVGFSGSFVF